MSEVTQTLTREADAARILLLNVRDVLAGDEDAIEDAIEGETNFKEAAAKAVERLAEIDAILDAIKTQRSNLAARAERLDAQSESIRAALVSAMATADLVKLELAQATLSRKPTPPKVIVTDETAIPAAYWKRADPKLDLRSIGSDLKSGNAVPGAEMSNGGETVAVRWR